MTKYVNKNTGAVIETECQLLGEWVPDGTLSSLEDTEKTKVIENIDNKKNEDTTESEEQPQQKEEVSEQPEDLESYDGITVKQIKQELDAFGIEYDPRAKKKELYDLMLQGK